ncbi:MAG TPA: hypothetical protein VNH11_25740 [Pirellulales bacterium]|nr:hypothetical protein [Pirellulales bacterium]
MAVEAFQPRAQRGPRCPCSTDRLRTWAARWRQAGNTDEFLRDRFFTALAASRGLPARPVDEERAIAVLVAAGEELKSPLGYSPITDVPLLASAGLLADEQLVLEIGRATQLLKALQRRSMNRCPRPPAANR